MQLPESAAEAAKWILLVGLAFYAADATSAVIGRNLRVPETPLPQAVVLAVTGDVPGQSAPPELISLLRTTGPTGGVETDKDESEQGDAKLTAPAAASQIGQLRLQGTLAAANGAGLAILEYQGASQVVSSGDQIAGFTLRSVTAYSVTLEGQGGTFLLELDSQAEGSPTLISPQPATQQGLEPGLTTEEEQESESAPPEGSSGPILSKDELTSILDNPESFMQGLIAKAEVVGDEVRGIRVQMNSPSHPLARLGIADGDIVKSLNGTVLEGPESLSEVYRILRNTSELRFEVERNGQNQTVDLSLD